MSGVGNVTVKLKWTLTSNDIYFTDYYIVSSVNPVSGALTTLTTVFTPDTYTIDAAGTLQLTPFPFPVTVSVPPGTIIVVQAHGMASQPGFGGGGLSVPSNPVVAGGEGFTILAASNPNDEQTDHGYGTPLAFSSVPIPNEGAPLATYGTIVAQTIGFGNLQAFYVLITGFGPALLSLVVQGPVTPPAQNAFSTLTYTDKNGVQHVLASNNLGPLGAFSQGSNNMSAWVWDLGADFTGDMTPGNQYVVTMT